MPKPPCTMWWQGAPCEVLMTDDGYRFVFYAGNGIGRSAFLPKSEITRVSVDNRRAFVGMKPDFAKGRSLLMATLFGGMAGAAEMVATTTENPVFEQRWFFTVESSDGGIVELEFDRRRAHNGGMTKQGVSVFLVDFRLNRGRYTI